MEEGPEMRRVIPVEGDWNAAAVRSECRPYLFPLMAFEAVFLFYAEDLQSAVVGGRRFRLRLRFGAYRANDKRLSYSVWEGDSAQPGGEPPLLVRRVFWDQAADQARQHAYSKSIEIGDGRSGMDLFGLWPDISLDSALLDLESTEGLALALVQAEKALGRSCALSKNVADTEEDWDGFSLEAPGAFGALGASSRRLRWSPSSGSLGIEGVVLCAMKAVDRELARPRPRPANVTFEYTFPPDAYRSVLTGPGRLAPGAAVYARAELEAGERPVELVSGVPAAEGACSPDDPPGSLARAFASRANGPAVILVGYEGDGTLAVCGQVMRVVLGEPGGDIRVWCVYRGEREGAKAVFVVRRVLWKRASDLICPPASGVPTVEERGAVVPAGRAGTLGGLLARAEAAVLAGPGAPDGAVGSEIEVMRRLDWGEASFGGRAPEGSDAARFACDAAQILDLEIGRSVREACSIVLDYVFPREGFPLGGAAGQREPEGLNMRMYGSSPRDPSGDWAELDSVELESCRIVLDEGDARELLSLLTRARRASGSGAAYWRLRSGRPTRLEHGDAGEPDLILYPGSPGKGGGA